MPDIIILAADVPDSVDVLNAHARASNFVTGREMDYEYLIVTQPEHLDGVAPLDFMNVLVSRNFFSNPKSADILNLAHAYVPPPVEVAPVPEPDPPLVEGEEPPVEEPPAEESEPDEAEPVEEVDPTTDTSTGGEVTPPQETEPSPPAEPEAPTEEYPLPDEEQP